MYFFNQVKLTVYSRCREEENSLKFRSSIVCYSIERCMIHQRGKIRKLSSRVLFHLNKSRSASPQVLPLKVGRPSVATTWLLESPGHLANKFTSFVRVIYTEPGDGNARSNEEAGGQSGDPVAPLSPSKASTEVADKGEEGEDVTDSKTSLQPADGENPVEEAPPTTEG